ncbi:ankyrin repeat-containing domain protein [Gongronella butleri]|nr:ankyrin repeat-containing domain protein [Gongronella butleri]
MKKAYFAHKVLKLRQRASVEEVHGLIQSSSLDLVNQQDSHGDALVHFAAREHDVALLRVLHDCGACMDLVNEHGRQPLHEALSNEECTRFLLETCKVDANAMKRGGWTPVIMAAMQHDFKMLKLLIEHGALVNVKAKDGRTPLHFAVQQGQEDMARFVALQDPLLALAATNAGRIPAQAAAGLTRDARPIGFRLVQFFLTTIAPMVSESTKTQLVRHVDQAGCTMLEDAIVSDQQDTVQWLVEQGGADPGRLDALGRQGWHHAAMVGHVAMLRLWNDITHGKGLDDPDHWDNWTPLMHAAKNNHLETVQCLLNLGANPLLRDKLGRTAKDIALLWHLEAIAQQL